MPERDLQDCPTGPTPVERGVRARRSGIVTVVTMLMKSEARGVMAWIVGERQPTLITIDARDCALDVPGRTLMVKSFFEEKSYESAFNAELAQGVEGSPFRHFAPGARLEAMLGFDVMTTLESRNTAWRAMGLTHRSGVSIHHRAPNQLPDAVFNLFIQYKRSDALKSSRAMHHTYFGGLYYRFRFDTPKNQLATLHELAAASGSAAHIVYAAPEFHTVQELWDAMIAGKIIANSVIVEATQLQSGHKAFNFKTGKTSLQNPEPEPVKASPADVWFAQLEGRTAPLTETLGIAHAAVQGVPQWVETWRSSQPRLLGGEPFSEDPLVESAVQQFAEVTAFTWAQGLTWILAGPNS